MPGQLKNKVSEWYWRYWCRWWIVINDGENDGDTGGDDDGDGDGESDGDAGGYYDVDVDGESDGDGDGDWDAGGDGDDFKTWGSVLVPSTPSRGGRILARGEPTPHLKPSSYNYLFIIKEGLIGTP